MSGSVDTFMTESAGVATPVRRLKYGSTLERIDPVFSMNFWGTAQTSFVSPGGEKKKLSILPSGVVGVSSSYLERRIRTSKKDLYSSYAKAIMACLVQWSPLTTAQLAGMVGRDPRFLQPALHALFGEGLIQRAECPVRDELLPLGGVGHLYRVNFQAKSEMSLWASRLTDTEMALIFCLYDVHNGAPSTTSSSSVRHNLATAEIVMRAYEYMPHIAGAWGDAVLAVNNFIDEDRIQKYRLRRNVADAALVSRSGEIVLLEVASSSSMNDSSLSKKIVDKIAGWMVVMARSELPLRLAMVDVSANAAPLRFRHQVSKGVERGAEMIPKTSDKQRVSDQVFAVCAASDWFPFAHCATRGFAHMSGFAVSAKEMRPMADLSASWSDNDAAINALTALHTPTALAD